MICHRWLCVTFILGTTLTMAPPLWADRDDDDGRPPRRQEQPRQQREEPRPLLRRDQAPEQRREPGREVRPQQPPRAQHQEPVRPPPRIVVPSPLPKPVPGYVLDTRHRHNHYYPPRGYVVPVLPPVHRIIRYHNVPYHYHDGIWYRPSGSRFVVVRPPIGIVVPVLPPFYTTIWIGAIPYYYAGGVYYTWAPDSYGYVVTEPPPESDITDTQTGADQLFIYPKQGQSEEQQAKDRYECHRWAVEQTAFDPTQPGGNVPTDQHASKRDDYFRAMKACLEARGYSVQ